MQYQTAFESVGLCEQPQISEQLYMAGGYGAGGSTPCGTGNLCCDLYGVRTRLCECMGGDLVFMHVKAKSMAFGGLLLALSVSVYGAWAA